MTGRCVDVTRLAVTVIAAAVTASHAHAQCTQWAGKNGSPGLTSGASAVTTWDPDGSGPLPTQVVVGGSMSQAGNVSVTRAARWDGTSWYALGNNLNDTVYAMASWDPDGPGPLPAQLVAGGAFQVAGSRVAVWNGTTWQSLGGGVNNYVYALTNWDPDGDGPQNPLLIAAGVFDTAGGAPANRIAAWNGTSWQPLGSGMNGWAEDIRTLTTWDPDGSGPLPPRLIAGGYFSVAGGTTVKNIAQWDGVSWSPLGAGLGVGADTNVSRLTTWDPDGPGPQSARLIASGYFFASGSQPLNLLAWWDGASWQAFGAGLDTFADVLMPWDPDGDGPQNPLLLAGGGQIFELPPSLWIKAWNGINWTALGDMPSSTAGAGVVWDPDGSGPAQSQPLIVGGFQNIGGVRYNGVARWDGGVWQPLGIGLSGTIASLCAWDPDGSGPQQERMVAGGAIGALGGSVVNNLASWSGTAWEPLGGGLNGTVASLVCWDADGAGPALPLLAVGGSFTGAGGVPAQNAAVWNGSSWSALGSGIASGVRAMTAWDPDGAGPQPQTLVATDVLTFVNDQPVQRIWRWDGAAWQQMGVAFTSYALCLGRVESAAGDELYVSINNNSQAGIGGRVLRWDGAAWTQVGGQFAGNIRVMTAWDRDGSGPQPAHLVVGGDFTSLYTGGQLQRIAEWDGSAWRQIGEGLNNTVSSLGAWDMDGDGPQPAQLVAAGSFTQSGASQCRYLARFDSGSGGAWVTLRSDAAQSIGAMGSLRRPVTGPGRDELFVSMEGARLQSSGASPMILQQPAAAEVCAGAGGGTALMSATVLSSPDTTLRWQVQNPSMTSQWVDLTNGPFAVGGQNLGVFSGVNGPALTVTGVQFPPGVDALGLRLRTVNACGTVDSAQVPLWHDPADLGATGGVPGHDGARDNNDFVVFIDAFFNGSTAADVGTIGGARGSDGLLNNNDFVVFIDLFFRDCP